MSPQDVPSRSRRSNRPPRRASRSITNVPTALIQPLESRVLLTGVPVAYNFVSLVSFTGLNAGQNGATPYSLTMDSHGDLIGATSVNNPITGGTLFELAGGIGPIDIVASFNASNGYFPHGAVATDSAGNIYGIVVNGGVNGQGGIYKYTPGAAAPVIIASFSKDRGYYPTGGLTIDSQGNLFGTTTIGGPFNLGSIYELPAGTSTIKLLAIFNGTNGSLASSALTLDARGDIFGVAEQGGVFNDGTVFELPVGSSTITVLASLDGTIGAFPLGSVVFDAHGDLFGTASQGGLGYGSIFELAAGATVLTAPVYFDNDNGATPTGSLLIDAQGNLFGTTLYGGATSAGTVFEFAAGGTVINTLIAFNVTNGYQPAGNLFADSHGNLFGTTLFGGPANVGTVFELQGTGVNFLTNLYHDVLGRAADPGGLAYWNSLLASGTPPSAIAATFVNSTEARQNEIQAAYQNILGRPADPTGLNTWLTALQNGTSIESVQAQLYGSTEYINAHGGTASSVISAYYPSILGRPVDAPSLTYWTQKISSGASFTQIAFSLIKSPESSQRIAAASYITFLHRVADPGGLAYWTAQLAGGLSQTDLEITFTSSSEYLNL